MNKRILIVTPRSPFEGRGADEQDRLSGIKWFIENGYEVRVITKTLDNDIPYLNRVASELSIKIYRISYKFRGKKDFLKRLFNPNYWDGAAYEYFDSEIQRKLAEQVSEFNPDIVWFDYTYLWPLYKIAKKGGAKIITRSINFEPEHFLDEDGRMPWNYLRAIPKYMSELRSLRNSDFFFAITLKEEKIYKKMAHTPVFTLPLRALPKMIGKQRVPRSDGYFHIGFMASNYNVHHNLEALLFLTRDILPLFPSEIKDNLLVHVTGNKLPKKIQEQLPKGVVYDGFVPSSSDFWLSMDIAVVPSVFGAGMQQKIFEPLTLGVPTITSKRGLAGYPFECGKSVLCAETSKGFVDAIVRLARDSEFRSRLGEEAKKVAATIFSKESLDRIIEKAVEI
jgi:glycosyltransferase involved in cell wall biosynthesis